MLPAGSYRAANQPGEQIALPDRPGSAPAPISAGGGGGGGAWGRSMSLRKPRGEVGEGGPCVSVLLFGGSGGGGKMAAHGGSAASSALKGLIQQFTAITGKRRGYRKVESGVWSGRPFRPGLPLTFMHFSLGLSPQLPSSLLRKRRRRRRVSGFRRETAPPRTPYLVLGLLAVWRATPPLTPNAPIVIQDPGNGPISSAPAGPGTWGRERWGAAPGPPPSSSFITFSSLCSRGVQCISHLLFPFFLGQVILPQSLACPSPFWAPQSHRRGPGVLGPSRLNDEAGGFGSAFTDPGG